MTCTHGFFRWASDRLHDDGVIVLITGRKPFAKESYDGFRHAVADEFSEIYVFDLGGDVRDNPKLSGTKHNVFGIQIGVAISFLVKRKNQSGCKIFYARRPEMDTAEDKLSFLASTRASNITWQRIEPSPKALWLDQTENAWDQFIPIASKGAKANKAGAKNQAVFRIFSRGLETNRDDWAYDFNSENLISKVSFLISSYEARRTGSSGDLGIIKWDRQLERRLRSNEKIVLDAKRISVSAYRPFVKNFAYFDRQLNAYTNQLPQMLPSDGLNQIIGITDPFAQKPWMLLATAFLPDLHLVGAAAAANCFPRYRYTPDGERIDNITDWGLKQFHKAYGKDGRGSGVISPLVEEMAPLVTEGGEAAVSEYAVIPPSAGPAGISPTRGENNPEQPSPPGASPPQGGRSAARAVPITKDDIFHYVYGVLHDPVYRETYAQNLKREFPRIPFYPDFWKWAEWGRQLMELHIGYETVEPWPLTRLDTPDEKAREAGVTPKTVLKADRDNGLIRLDSETTLSGIPAEVWTYRLGNRSGIEWILD